VAIFCGTWAFSELLIQGKERPYLQWFYEHFAYDPSAIGASDIDVYVAAITQVGALRAGLAVYQDYFATAEQVAALAKKPLTNLFAPLAERRALPVSR
jgi:hypothetical protein